MFQPLRNGALICALLFLAYDPAGAARARHSDVAVATHIVVEPGYVFDDFQQVDIKAANDTDDDPYWWLINNGGAGQVYDNCADATCITREHNGNLKYARLQLLPDSTPAVWDGSVYNGTEISEYRTLYSSTQAGRWLPTYGHPVSVSARVRFSSNYGQDGSGGAVGSAGFWLWNSYPDMVSYAPVSAFGFNWMEAGAAGDLEGLRISALQETYPLYNEPLAGSVDLSAWHVWKFVWSADVGGDQSVEWWLDGTSIGQTDFEEPFDALSLTVWNDNQFAQTLEGDAYTVTFHNPASTQNFDIDWVEIEQPQ